MTNTMSIGAFEAKTKFSELLERVSQGEEFTITRHEKPVARLVPYEKPSQVELATLFQRMADFRAGHPLNSKGQEQVSYRELIDGGRHR